MIPASDAACSDSPLAAASEVFLVRRMVATDLAFVMNAWLHSLPRRACRRCRHRDITDGIADGSIVVLIACDRETPDHIAGWLAAKAGVEEKSYVKAAYRGWGVDALLRLEI